MFFWKNKKFLTCYFPKNKKASLRACHKKSDPNICGIPNNLKRIKNRISKRTFFLTPSYYQASMCVEASLAFSLFLFFLVNVFSIIFLFITYTEDITALQQRGKKLSMYAYATEDLLAVSDPIRLQNFRVIQSPFSILKTPGCKLYSQCVVKPWTGYDVTLGKGRTEEDTIVYIAEYGTVYHKNRSCTHISLSIQAISSATVIAKRNDSGENYMPCTYCKDKGFATVYFITSYGNKYHTTTKCRGLKRTVKSVRLSEVEGVSPCQKCG